MPDCWGSTQGASWEVLGGRVSAPRGHVTHPAASPGGVGGLHAWTPAEALSSYPESTQALACSQLHIPPPRVPSTGPGTQVVLRCTVFFVF